MRERAFYMSKLGKVQYLWCRSHSGTRVIGFQQIGKQIKINFFIQHSTDLHPWENDPKRFKKIEQKEAERIILAVVQSSLDMISNQAAGGGAPAAAAQSGLP